MVDPEECSRAALRVAFPVPGSVPRTAAKAAWLKEHPEPWTREVELEYLRTFQGQIERWLDQGHGECLLRRGELAEIVAGAAAV